MKSSALINDFQTMLTEGWGYILGTSGVVWTQAKQDAATNDMTKQYGQKWVGKTVADCSGAFVYSFRKHGQTIAHGSNTIARKYISGSMLSVSDAKPGYAAFKHSTAGGEPSGYRNDGLGDYYHIGLVDASGKYVINAKGTRCGVKRDPIEEWASVAPLKGVDYDSNTDEEKEVSSMTAKVTAAGGVNLRASCSTTSRLIEKITQGESVTIINDAPEDGWWKVQHGTNTGYVMSKFLTKDDDTTESDHEILMDLVKRVQALEAENGVG